MTTIVSQQSVETGSLHTPSQEMPSKSCLAGKKRKSASSAPHERMVRANLARNALLAELSERPPADHLQMQPPLLALPLNYQYPMQHIQLRCPSDQWFKDTQVTQVQPLLHLSGGSQSQQQETLCQEPRQQPQTQVATVCCDVCNVDCVTRHNFRLHMQGKKHRAKCGEQPLKSEEKAKFNGVSLRVPSQTRELPQREACLTWCSLCNVNCNNSENLRRHLLGKPHKAIVEGVTVPYLKLHMQAQKNKAKYAEQSLISEGMARCSEVSPPGHSHSQELPKKDSGLAWCSFCNMNCNNSENLRRHLLGKLHKSRLNKHSLQVEQKAGLDEMDSKVGRRLNVQPTVMDPGPIWCTLCNVNCRNPENLRRHLRGKKHKAKWGERPLKALDSESQQPPEIHIAPVLANLCQLSRVEPDDSENC